MLAGIVVATNPVVYQPQQQHPFVLPSFCLPELYGGHYGLNVLDEEILLLARKSYFDVFANQTLLSLNT